jgi:hypothetical protein
VCIKLKDNKIASGFSQTQQYIILFAVDDNVRSLDHHQAIFAKFRIALHIPYSTFCKDDLMMGT